MESRIPSTETRSTDTASAKTVIPYRPGGICFRHITMQPKYVTLHYPSSDAVVLLNRIYDAGGPSVASQQGEVASFLTPPDSQLLSTYQRNCMVMSISSIPNGDDEDAMGIKFLRAYFFLEHQLRRRSSVASAGTFVLENDVVRQSVGAILGYVERSLRRNPTDFHHCLESLRLCVKLLDHHSTSDVQKQWFTAVRDAFVRTSTKCLQSFEHGGMQKPFALLQILAGSTTLAPQLAESLLKLLSESLLILMDWDLSQLLPESILDVLSRVSYYVLLIEKALPRLSPGNRKRLIHLYPDVHPTIRVHFPLLASSLIRLQAQLAWKPHTSQMVFFLIVLLSVVLFFMP